MIKINIQNNTIPELQTELCGNVLANNARDNTYITDKTKTVGFS